MITQSTRNRRLFVWRGLVIMLFSLASLVWPVTTLIVLRLLFGAYALADGPLALIVGQLDRHEFYYHRWMLRLRGLASIALGVFICLWSSVTVPALATIIATWAILTSAFEVMAVNVVVSERQSVWGNLIKHKILRVR
ncbi:MAG: DUF308 domain-containing protein [Anaerolineae bacterium]|nr:DUF308 domain-containing protein [Anaerolineae bacterium]